MEEFKLSIREYQKCLLSSFETIKVVKIYPKNLKKRIAMVPGIALRGSSLNIFLYQYWFPLLFPVF